MEAGERRDRLADDLALAVRLAERAVVDLTITEQQREALERLSAALFWEAVAMSSAERPATKPLGAPNRTLG